MPVGNALLTNGFKLECGNSEVVDVREFPDLLGDAESLETTTLGDTMQTARPGLKGSDTLSFTCLFSGMGLGTNWKLLKDVEDTGEPETFTVTLSSGDELEFDAYVTMGMPGKGPNDILEFTANLMPSSEIDITPYVEPEPPGEE